jgi:hypothetical protein
MEKITIEANRYLDTFGIKHSNMGFRYLITAVEIGYERPQLLFKISDLYGEIAQVYKTNKSSVEKSIRYAILSSGLTNKEFIMRAVDSINMTIVG